MADDTQEVSSDNVNIVGPDGKLGSVAPDQVNSYLNSPFTKYRLASQKDLQDYQEKQKYESFGQRSLANVEEAARSGTFGISTGGERVLSEMGVPGLTKEDIQKREEHLPTGQKIVSSLAGLGASALIPGLGEANALKTAGEVGAEALGLGAERVASRAFESVLEKGGTKEAANIAKEAALAPYSTASKIGSGAVKEAIGAAGFQSGDEVHKMFLNEQDPHAPLQTAMINIGLAGLFGAGTGLGLGSVSPLWKSTIGPKVSQLLEGVQNKLGGLESSIPDAINDAAATSGIDIAPEVKAALSDDPRWKQSFQTLQESSTGSGLKAQEALKNFKVSAQDSLVRELGRTPEDVANLGELSSYDSGKKVQDAFHQEVKNQYAPIKDLYKNIETKFNDVALSSEDKALIQDKIANLVQEKGYYLSPSSTSAQLIDKTVGELNNIQNVNDLKKYISIINEKTSNPELWKVGGDLRSIYRDSMGDVLNREVGKESPELLNQYSMANTAYKKMMNTIDSLNDRLHVGKYSGPESFLKSLQEMGPEDILRRASGKNDADLLNMMSQEFPQSAQAIKEYHIDSLLKNSAANAGEGNILSTKKLFGNLDKLSPELKAFAFPNATSESLSNKFNAVKTLLNALPEKMNTSGTAKTLDALWSKVPGSALGFASLLTGHNPLLSFMMEPLSHWVSRDIPDAARLAMLKFVGSGQSLNSGGFKAMADFVSHLKTAEKLLDRATKSVFEAGEIVLPKEMVPDQKSRDKLDAKIEQLKADPSPLFNIGGATKHYMPEQGQAMGQLAMNAMNVLSQLKPSSVQLSPLDSKIPIDKAKQKNYDRALDIAEQPLLVLKHIKSGTLQPTDVMVLGSIYPQLKDRMTQKLMGHIAKLTEDQKNVPYKIRMGLSLFGGQPLDSTMTPQGIMSAQATFQQNASPTQQAPDARGGHAHSMKALSKISEIDQTPSQARQIARSKN